MPCNQASIASCRADKPGIGLRGITLGLALSGAFWAAVGVVTRLTMG